MRWSCCLPWLNNPILQVNSNTEGHCYKVLQKCCKVTKFCEFRSHNRVRTRSAQPHCILDISISLTDVLNTNSSFKCVLNPYCCGWKLVFGTEHFDLNNGRCFNYVCCFEQSTRRSPGMNKIGLKQSIHVSENNKLGLA